MENLELITTATYKLGVHKNRGDSARLWIEGLRLFNAGFDSGDRYSIVTTDTDITIIKTPDGTHKVAGSPKNGKPRPIIDRHDANWRAMFGAKVRADFYNGMIVISRGEA